MDWAQGASGETDWGEEPNNGRSYVDVASLALVPCVRGPRACACPEPGPGRAAVAKEAQMLAASVCV